MSSELLPTLAAYVPPSLIQAALNNSLPLIQIEPSSERFPGAVLFADISGFTPLTEALGQKGAEGPEELTRLLNRYFTWMIAFVEAQGGEVVKFGGDALMVVFPTNGEPLGQAVRRAMQAAETMQSAMEEFGIMESSVGIITLKMKIGIGVGEILSARVGGVDNRWEYIIAGDPLHQAAQAEHRAGQNEIVLSPEAAEIMVPYGLPARPLTHFNWSSIQNPTAVEAILRCYVPKPVRTWLDQELHGWLASLRPMSVIFVKVIGLDYDRADSIGRLHRFICGVQESLDHYEGSLVRLTVDDKGTGLLILFGAPPHPHEDDSERALRCALDLQTLAERQGLALSIGVTTGRVFAGPVGSETRREYTVMGDTVNLAARLMVMTPPGQVSCSYDTYRSTYDRLNFEALPPIEVKGKAGPILVYRPYRDDPNANQQNGETPDEFAGLLLGREREMSRLMKSLEKVQAGQTRIVILEGEAGIGKSHLAHTLLQAVKPQELVTLRGVGRSIEQETAYLVWRDILLAYFELEGADLANPEKQAAHRAHVRAAVLEAGAEVVGRLPFFNDILPLAFPETEISQGLDAASRRDELCQLLLALLRLKIEQGKLPLLILDDAQWLDPLSWKLAVQLAVAAIKTELPLFLILMMRPLEGVVMRTETAMLADLHETEYIRLDTLPSEEILNLVAAQMGLTTYELPEAVSELISRRASGNPYFAEELLHALWDSGLIAFKSVENKPRCLISGDWNRAAQMLPATIQSTILTRIDQLPPEKQLLLKVAAVMGQAFAYQALRDVLGQHMELEEDLLKLYLDDLTYLDLIRVEQTAPHLIYSFKHAILRDVTYQSLLFDRRRRLHRTVAQWYEQNYQPEAEREVFRLEINQKQETNLPLPHSLTAYYSLLVYHWHLAEDEEKELHYAVMLGEQAVAQFANAEALGYLNRALTLAPPSDLACYYKLLLARETVYDRYGDREKQAQDLGALSSLVEPGQEPQKAAIIALREARYAEATGDYKAALEAAQQVLTLSRPIQNAALEAGGCIVWAETLIHRGDYEAARTVLEEALARTKGYEPEAIELLLLRALLAWRQGRYQAARADAQQALDRAQTGHARLKAYSFRMLGLICFHLGDYGTARNYLEQAVALYYMIGDRRGEIKSFYTIGSIYLSLEEIEIARDYFEQTLETADEIGDREVGANTLSQLGLVYCKLGDYTSARGYLGQALGIHQEIGNRAGEATALSKFGYVYYCMSNYKTAQRYCDLALEIQSETGDRWSQRYNLTCLGHVLADQGHLEAAVRVYEEAICLHRQMDRPGLAVDALAGLGRVKLMQNDLTGALACVEQITAQVEVDKAMGIIDRFWVYLAIYQVLAVQPALALRAQAILAAAYRTLHHKSASLSNHVVQRNFLDKIKVHRELVSLWEAARSATSTMRMG